MKISDVRNDMIECSQLKIHRNGSQSVYMQHDKKNVSLQTDTVSAVDITTCDIKFNCSPELAHTLRTFDEIALRDANHRSLEWFGKELDHDVIDKLFAPTVNVNNGVTAKLIDTDIFAKSKHIIDSSRIHKGCPCIFILELLGVYFAKKRFGLTWNVKQILAAPENTISGYAFDDDIIVPII